MLRRKLRRLRAYDWRVLTFRHVRTPSVVNSEAFEFTRRTPETLHPACRTPKTPLDLRFTALRAFLTLTSYRVGGYNVCVKSDSLDASRTHRLSIALSHAGLYFDIMSGLYIKIMFGISSDMTSHDPSALASERAASPPTGRSDLTWNPSDYIVLKRGRVRLRMLSAGALSQNRSRAERTD